MVCVCGTKRLWLYPPGDARPAGFGIQGYSKGRNRIPVWSQYTRICLKSLSLLRGEGRNSTVWCLHRAHMTRVF